MIKIIVRIFFIAFPKNYDRLNLIRAKPSRTKVTLSIMSTGILKLLPLNIPEVKIKTESKRDL